MPVIYAINIRIIDIIINIGIVISTSTTTAFVINWIRRAFLTITGILFAILIIVIMAIIIVTEWIILIIIRSYVWRIVADSRIIISEEAIRLICPGIMMILLSRRIIISLMVAII